MVNMYVGSFVVSVLSSLTMSSLLFTVMGVAAVCSLNESLITGAASSSSRAGSPGTLLAGDCDWGGSLQDMA
jgi:hypothetical protein